MDDLSANNEFQKLVRRMERLERGAPIGFSAVSRGALRIISEEGLIVVGSARITGVMNGDGNLNWSGPITFTGPFTINGTTIQNGEYTVNGHTTVEGVFDVVGPSNFTGEVTVAGGWHFTGDGDITGNVGLTGTLTVGSGGEIKVGAMTLSPDEYEGVAGRITAPIAITLDAPIVSIHGDTRALGNLTIAGVTDMPFLPERVGTPLVIDAFGRIGKAPA